MIDFKHLFGKSMADEFFHVHKRRFQNMPADEYREGFSGTVPKDFMHAREGFIPKNFKSCLMERLSGGVSCLL